MSNDHVTPEDMFWKIHTPNLLNEIAKNPECSILKIPLKMLGLILFAVGERASELNDPRLNALMCQLTIYAIADPHSPHYDVQKAREVMRGLAWTEKEENENNPQG